jgi:hypothetical protein
VYALQSTLHARTADGLARQLPTYRGEGKSFG